MRIAICDDDRREREQLVDALHGWDPTRMPECFYYGSGLLEAAKQEPPFDIAFLDIYLPGESGVDIARQLQAVSPETGIVFVTTSHDHAVDAFSLQALHYLVKPATTEQVVESFRRLAERNAKSIRPRIVLTGGDGTYSLYVDEICYIQSADHAKVIALSDGRSIRVWQTLEELIPRLGENFLKLNRGTYVNMAYVDRLENRICWLKDGVCLELSRREAAAVRAAYDDYLFSQLPGGSRYGKGGLP